MQFLSRKLTIILVSILSLIVIGAFGWVGLQYAKVHRYQSLGDKAIEDGSWQVASFWFGKILESDPDHPYALRQMAHFSSLFLDNSEVLWWKRWHDSFPDDTEIRLGYAEVLIRNGFFNDAKAILDSTLPTPGQASKYHNLLTGYYLGIGDFLQAERFTRRSLEVSPESVDLKLNLLNILLRIGNPDQMDELNRLLADITTEPERLPDVWRVMLSYSLSRQDHDNAIALAGNLASRESASWREQAAHLKLLIYHRPEHIEAQLFSHTDPELSFFEEVSRTLLQADRATLVLDWDQIISSEAALKEELTYRILIAEAMAQEGRWQDLEPLLTQQSWEVLDYYRNALLARLFHAKDDAILSRKHWQQAISETRNSLHSSRNLANIAQNWPGFEMRWVRLLEDKLQQSVNSEWAYQRLHEHFYQLRETHRLHQISLRARRVLPSNDNVRNNLIMYSLLTGQDPATQLEEAESLYEDYPGKPIPTTTYGFTLFMNGRYEEAWQIMQELDPRFFEIAEIAYYAALIAARSGHAETAEALSDVALEATLLPEELALSEGVL